MSKDSFMQPQMTEKQYWYEVDGDGTDYIPADLIKNIKPKEAHEDITNEQWDAIKDYTDTRKPDQVMTIRKVYGYGVRLSAPGYMDCTDWEVYTNKREAEKRARELEEGED